MTKELKEKAIDIKGKQYVLVSDRVLFFNGEYPKGMIQTKLISYEGKKIVMEARVTPDVSIADRYFTGWSQEVEGVGMVNSTSALENAETSAVGRALAMMGIGVIDSIASVDEITKATNRASVGVSPSTTTQAHIGANHCPKCNAVMKVSKVGKSYCSALCWKTTGTTTEPTVTSEQPTNNDIKREDVPF